ncbi:M23 family metallopeptidase [Nocardia higoensis]|uniref:M23 family metallopeptidase n=1 Tax=Nocardia higoensis TaxID=228599 RepID=UPI0035711629
MWQQASAHRGPEAPDASAWNQDSEAWNNDSAWNDGAAWNQNDGATWHQQSSWNNGSAWGTTETADSDAGWNQGEASQWQGTCDSDAWARQSQWNPGNESGWTDDEGDDDRSGNAPAATPAAPAFIPGRGTARRGGAHRVPAPPGSLKGRAAVVAVAAGAVVAAGQAAMADPGQPSQTLDYEAAGQIHEIAAQSMSLEDPNNSSASPQVLNVAAPSNLSQFNEILENGRKYAEELAAAEAAKLRPLFAQFTYGNFTSGYGARWGVQHLGVDIAAPIGTPIYAVADGTVIDAGPASGFGMWVRIKHEDGTVTVYGHVDTATVSVGEYVMAGDQIATVGNRGFSTGPHVHFEVWLNGNDKVDPLPWLASRGISLGQYRG